ncbi:hypothetical protein P9597_03585 [Aneurinibacillus migulanus]|uniref:DUF6884 domain-containing protein n=1 Tax=Aneurinibacillus migulanus TaxID=47500 RepID=UPI002E1D7206|nr:DUF6884 domain-containing protein [Aneurinibacillus migulanus]MED4727235.1 hypothetical protein [Aneurinibacillus migulanus]
MCIVPCGNKKIWEKDINAGPTQAKNVYIGSFAKKCREYAQRFYADSWVILSAKYGFLFPDDIIEGPYNVTFNKKSTSPITIEELSIQAKRKQLSEFNEIVVVGGKNYVKIAKEVFQGKKITEPLSSCAGMGFMMKKLKSAIDHNTLFE